MENTSITVNEELCDSFIKNDFCQGYTPSPLGDDRARFLQLVNDIRLRKDDYASQLSQLTIASMGTSTGKETKGDILASLVGKNKLQETANTEKLWQARLLLKLAEILEEEEEELSLNLAILQDYEDNLVKELQGELGEDEENLLEELQSLQKNMTQHSTSADVNRFAAWKTMHAMAGDTHQEGILLTDNSDSAERVLDACSHTVSTQSLNLPSIISWDGEEALKLIRQFEVDNKALLNELGKAIETGRVETELNEQWNAIIEKNFPHKKHGQRKTSLYNLEEKSWNRFVGTKDSNTRLLLVVED